MPNIEYRVSDIRISNVRYSNIRVLEYSSTRKFEFSPKFEYSIFINIDINIDVGIGIGIGFGFGFDFDFRFQCRISNTEYPTFEYRIFDIRTFEYSSTRVLKNSNFLENSNIRYLSISISISTSVSISVLVSISIFDFNTEYRISSIRIFKYRIIEYSSTRIWNIRYLNLRIFIRPKFDRTSLSRGSARPLGAKATTPITPSVRGVYFTTPSVVFLCMCAYMHQPFLWVFTENKVHHISGNRRRILTKLSGPVDLVTRYCTFVPFSASDFRFRR